MYALILAFLISTQPYVPYSSNACTAGQITRDPVGLAYCPAKPGKRP